MKATEFCKFFDFTLEKGEFEVKNDFIYDDGVYKYRATDDQGVFADRYTNDITDITDWFDSCLQDYINDDVEEDGFVYVKEQPGSYYEQMLSWLKENGDTYYYYVVASLVDPRLIVDDLREEEK